MTNLKSIELILKDKKSELSGNLGIKYITENHSMEDTIIKLTKFIKAIRLAYIIVFSGCDGSESSPKLIYLWINFKKGFKTKYIWSRGGYTLFSFIKS